MHCCMSVQLYCKLKYGLKYSLDLDDYLCNKGRKKLKFSWKILPLVAHIVWGKKRIVY